MTELQLRRTKGWAVLVGAVLGASIVFFMHRAASEHAAQKAAEEAQCAQLLAAVKKPDPQYQLECVFEHGSPKP